MRRLAIALGLAGLLLASTPSDAARPAPGPEVAPFVLDDAEVFALTGARVIDGTGAAPKDGHTIVLRNGVIEAVGPSAQVSIPEDAKVIDLVGKTVLPGLVQLHEHLWIHPGAPISVPVTYPRLFLSAGVTSIRTAGSYNPYADLRAKKQIEAGLAAGPWMDLTIYTDALATPELATREEVERYLDFWIGSGFSSVKVYSRSGPEQVRWIVEHAHSLGAKVLGHICNVSYVEAAEIGMDSIEHGFAFFPDVVPGIADGSSGGSQCALAALTSMDHVDVDSAQVDELINRLARSGVAITSTLPALEDITAVGGPPDGLELLADFAREHNRAYRARADSGEIRFHFSMDSLRKSVALERKFFQAGGLLVAGTDSTTPAGGVVAGYSAARQLELMVENGFTPLEAIRISTLNGAIALDRADRIGSIEAGKQADLLVVEGDPAADISDLRKVKIVFKQGVAYDPQALRESVRGRVGVH